MTNNSTLCVADHAPHPREAKECEWDAAAFGMVGLESALSVVHAAVVEDGRLSWADVSRVLSSAPARIGRLDGYQHGLAVGAAANVVLYDPEVRRRFSTDDLRGRSTNSPYLGRELPGRVVATLHRGVPTVLDGELVDAAVVAAAARSARG